MKILYTTLILLTAFLQISFAKVITVSNTTKSPAQYTNLQTALDAAAANDTIYVHGSENNYGGYAYITKPVTLIGPGYNPNKQSALRAYVQYIELKEFSPTVNSSNTKIMGMAFNQLYVGTVTSPIKNLILERNYCDYYINAAKSEGWIIRNNIIAQYVETSNTAVNLLISNNIFSGNYGINTHGSNAENILVTNNIFIAKFKFSVIRNVTFTNNIFYGFSPYLATSSFCTFNNNITYGSSKDSVYIAGTNSGGGNFIGVDPNFVNVPAPTSADFRYESDFHLKAASVGKNAGTDGTDIGIYGGSYPFPYGGPSPYMTSQEPALPQVQQMNILNSSIPANGTLKVNVIGKKQD